MKFETSVQELKNEVLTEVAKNVYGEKGEVDLISIPERLIPGPEARARCCIYKERAIVSERIKIAMGGDESNPNMVEVLPIACDECPVSQMSVSDACRGCIAHRCQNACPVNAITIVDHKAHIDKKKCIKCGKCLNACPYGAIIKQLRPCERACPVGAISMGENEKAHIDNDKCISCGACVYQCPFGAIMDKSYMSHTIKLLTAPNTTVHAIIAPSIASQFMPATMPQVIAGIKALGFEGVFEAALGADMVAPITKSDTLYFLAIDTAPDTRKSAPKTMPINAIMRIIYSIFLLQKCFYFFHLILIHFRTRYVFVRHIFKQLN